MGDTMTRTVWPHLNRARVHGVYDALNTERETRLIDPREEIPFNIQYPCDVLPETPEEILEGLRNSHVRPPFELTWHEFNMSVFDIENDENTFGVDTWGVSACDEKTNQVAISGGLSFQPDRGALRNTPTKRIWYCRVDLDAFTGNEESLGKLRYPEISVSNYIEDEAASQIADAASWFVYVILWSWLLLSCKNVELVESQPSHRTKKAQKDPTRVIHRELLVKNPPTARKKSASSRDDKRGTAHHLRRGHFADYTKGKGLFGKYHGRYWIPPMMVGDRNFGTVIKSYRVEGA